MDSSKRKLIIDAEADILKKKIDHEELFKFYHNIKDTDHYLKQYTRLNLEKQRIEIEIAELQLEELKQKIA